MSSPISFPLVHDAVSRPGDAAGEGAVRVELIGSSNGCRSFRVNADGRRLKCFECLTPAGARLVQRLSAALRRQDVAVPECFAVRGRVVFAEWVDGQPMGSLSDADKIPLMAAYQARIHGARLPRTFRRHASMPHTRWLFERLRRYGRGVVDDARLSGLRRRLSRSRPARAPFGVLHSDLITTNLVVTAAGVMSIDNEFLSAGYGQEFDILNTVNVSFPNQPRLQRRYIDAYAQVRSVHTLLSHRDYWEAVYDIKMAGKRLSEGRVDEGLRHLRSAADKT